jgi:hypothetical protein
MVEGIREEKRSGDQEIGGDELERLLFLFLTPYAICG